MGRGPSLPLKSLPTPNLPDALLLWNAGFSAVPLIRLCSFLGLPEFQFHFVIYLFYFFILYFILIFFADARMRASAQQEWPDG